MASGGLLASGVVTGGHSLTKTGAGTLTLSNGSDSFASLTVSSGSVLLGNAASVTNTLTINGGPVETTSTSTLSNALAFNGGTLAAASGTTLTATGSINVEGNTQSFGVAGQTGTIVLYIASKAFVINFGTHVLTVNGGTLQQAASTTALLGLASFPHSVTTIASGLPSPCPRSTPAARQTPPRTSIRPSPTSSSWSRREKSRASTPTNLPWIAAALPTARAADPSSWRKRATAWT